MNEHLSIKDLLNISDAVKKDNEEFMADKGNEKILLCAHNTQ